MAINTAPTNNFSQAPLDNLRVDSDLTGHTTRYTVPVTRDLDPRRIEIIVDLDLDEMLLYYYGREVPHDVEPVGDLISYLVQTDSDEVVGVIIHEYMSRAVREYPALSEAVRWAIIVSGDSVREPESSVDATGRGVSIFHRLKDQVLRVTAGRIEDEGRERAATTVRSLLSAV